MPIASREAAGLWFTAGRRKCWGEPGWHFRMGHLRELHPVFFVRTLRLASLRAGASHTRPLRILQGQLELARKRIHGRSRAFPHALALESHVADSTAPGRDDAPDGAVVGAVGVLLIEA